MTDIVSFVTVHREELEEIERKEIFFGLGVSDIEVGDGRNIR